MDVDSFDRFSELSFRLYCGTGPPNALYLAMKRGDDTAEGFAPSLCAGHLFLSETIEALNALIHRQEVRFP